MARARSSYSLLLTALIIHAASACSDGAAMTGESDGEVRDSVGITIVDNFGTPLWAVGSVKGAWPHTGENCTETVPDAVRERLPCLRIHSLRSERIGVGSAAF